MAVFNEAQLEQAFVELFKGEGYDYVHGENISRDTRDVILYDDLRTFLQEQHKAQGITDDEINRTIAKIETSEGGGVYVENVEALRLIQRGFSLRRTDPKLPDLYIISSIMMSSSLMSKPREQKTSLSSSTNLPLTENITASLMV